MFQTTIHKEFSFSGVGLHSGKEMPVTVMPAPADTGIQFARTDVQNCPFVRITPFNVTSTQLATTISCGDFPISTIEHLVSALYGLGVDNVYIKVEGPEIPILDGSAAPIVDLIDSVGIVQLEVKRKYLCISRDVLVEKDEKVVLGSPSSGLTITFEIEYPHAAIQHQILTLDLSPTVYRNTVANSRTFGFRSEVEALWKMGLAKGGSMENAIVLDDKDGILNPEGLRHKDEFVSHKILDLLGDVSLVGYRMKGHILAKKSGHQVNNIFARKLLESLNNYTLEEIDMGRGYGYLK
jgi:UDP-3-O-[3-hydroxymyristoyl] N-acetylglucosamine deacetylase